MRLWLGSRNTIRVVHHLRMGLHVLLSVAPTTRPHCDRQQAQAGWGRVGGQGRARVGLGRWPGPSPLVMPSPLVVPSPGWPSSPPHWVCIKPRGWGWAASAHLRPTPGLAWAQPKANWRGMGVHGSPGWVRGGPAKAAQARVGGASTQHWPSLEVPGVG